MNEKLKEVIQNYIGNSSKPIVRCNATISYEDILGAMKMIGTSEIPGFVIDKDNKFLYENLAKWIVNDKSMMYESPSAGYVIGDTYKGIYICGNTGTGKSAALDILKSVADILHFKIMFQYQVNPSYLTWGNYLATDICDTFARTGDMEEYKKKDILCIQDLGGEIEMDAKGNATADTLYMGNRRNVLRQILEARGDNPATITLITSNYRINGETVKNVYGSRVVSRLMQMCNYYELKGKDRRII